MSYIYQVISSKLAQRKHLKLFYEEKSFHHQLPRYVWLQYDLLSTNTFLYISSMCPKSSVEQILVSAQWSCIKMFGNGEIKGLPTNFPIIHYKTQQLRGLSFLVLTLGRVSRTAVHYAELCSPLSPPNWAATGCTMGEFSPIPRSEVPFSNWHSANVSQYTILQSQPGKIRHHSSLSNTEIVPFSSHRNCMLILMVGWEGIGTYLGLIYRYGFKVHTQY